MRSTGRPPSSGTRNRRAWPTGSPDQPTTSRLSPSAAYETVPATPVGERDHAGLRLRVVDVEQVHGGAEAQVAVVTHRAGEGEVVPSGDHAGSPACSVAVGELGALAGGEVDHVQLAADGAEHAGAVGLVVEPVGDQRSDRCRGRRGR